MRLDDLTLGQLADAVDELRRLRGRVDELLEANSREVERRRRLQAAVAEALRLAILYGGWNPEDLDALRHAINACPRCGAQAGAPCRTPAVGAALPIPHPERLEAP